MVNVERPDHPRLTLTLPVLSAATEVIFLVSGASKAERLQELMSDADIPAAMVHAQHVTVIADPAAAALVPGA